MKQRTFALLAILFSAALAAPALASTVDLGAPLSTVTLPSPAPNAFGVSVVFGPNDGLIYAWTGAQVLKQNSAGSSSYTSLGTVGSASSDPGSIAFNSNQTAFLLGNGAGGALQGSNAGKLFSIPASGGNSSTPVGNVPFQDSILAPAALGSTTRYLLDQGNASFTGSNVSIFDAANGSNLSVIDNIPGATSAMTVGPDGRLYVGIGYGPTRGELRSFDLTSINNAYNTLTPLQWTSGTVFNALDNNSGAGMFFDPRGYMFVGGPDGVTVFDTSGNARLFNNNGFTSVVYDSFHDQVYVSGFGDFQGMYATSSFLVPEPSSAVLALMASLALVVRLRRRRR